MPGHKQNLHILYISFKARKNESLLHIFFINQRVILIIEASEETWKDGRFHCFEDAHEQDQHAANVQ